MLKTIQKRMTVVLIVSMLLQLFAGVTPVLAEDSGDLIADPEFVPMLTVTLSPGETIGATSATVTDYVYGNLLVNITKQEIAIPRIGDTAPTTGDNLIADYKFGADITAGVIAGNYLQIYDVDVEEDANIISFYQAELTGEDINEEEIEEEIGEESGQNSAEDLSNQNVELIEDVEEEIIDQEANEGLMMMSLETIAMELTYHGSIADGGIYRLPEGFTGVITIGNEVNTVTIKGYNALQTHENTCIEIAGGRTNALTLAIEDLNMTAPSDSAGIDFANGGTFENMLKISGASHVSGALGYAGIHVPYSVSLTIISDDEGVLSVNGGGSGAGIGGRMRDSGGVITISGGTVTATGGTNAAGIGGGGAGGTININGGTITAIGGDNAAGIGGGLLGNCGNVTISNGKVTATGGSTGPGIGSGHGGSGGTVEISGGEVKAKGGFWGAGIGGGHNGDSGIVIISGGEVTATGGDDGNGVELGGGGAGIGGGGSTTKNGGSGGTIKISNGNVTATGGGGGAGIGGGGANSSKGGGLGGNIIINDGKVIAAGGPGAAGIGGGRGFINVEGGSVIISGGEVHATGGGNAAGIGGGALGSGGVITINGGTITTTGGSAGIGGGGSGAGGTITINAGTVIATGGKYASGIGGGNQGNGGQIIIKNGKVTATSGGFGAGIGGGAGSFDGTVEISGGEVKATGGSWGAGIGGGYKGDGGKITINDGIITATGGYSAAGIGGGHKSSGGKTNINGGYIMAIGGTNGAGIGGGAEGYYGEIIINDDTAIINAFGGLYGEDIGNGRYGEGATIIRRDDAKDIDLTDPGLEVVAGFGNALNFPVNTQSRINVPFKKTKLDEYKNDDTKISGNSDLTISMWIFPKENEPYQTLYRQEGSTIGHLGLDFRLIKYNDNEGYLYFGFNKLNYGWQWAWDWNNGIPPTDIIKVPMNRWTHVSLTKSGRSVILYANGIKYYEMTLDDMHYNAPAPLNGDISFGGTPFENQFFSGRMDEIQFWNTALTPDEIKAWMYREIDSSHNKYENLIYYYKFNQNSGTTVIDSKGSYDGTTVNMTDANWFVSDVKEWTVDADSILNGKLVGSYTGGSSNDGTDWNLIFEIVEQAKKGTATITGDNKFEYRTHDINQRGHDSFIFIVKDSNGRYSNIHTVNIEIIPKTNLHLPDPSDSTRPEKPEKTGAEIPVNSKTKTADTVTTTREGDKTVTTVVIDDKKVAEELAQEGNNAIVTISDTSGADVVIGTLNGQTVKNMSSKDAVLEIKTGQVTYTLPASQINIDTVSEQIGKQVELKDIAVSVKISEPAENTVKIALDTANENNYLIVVEPIEFEITCSSGSKTVEVTKFNAYVERMIAIPESIDPSKITTGVVLNSDGTFSHVPTAIIMIDGKYYAKINSLTNSVYSIIYSPITFKDVEKHWAKEAVNDMGSRLVISGTGKDNFEPDRDITRAEFAAIAVRALGLKRSGTGKDVFNDVPKNAWYYDAVAIAYEYGIISGYGNGKFGPDDKITREQAMTTIGRAMKITELKMGLADGEADKLLTSFTDANSAAEYAKASIASCVKAGIVSGRSGKLIAPKDNITRAEVAVIMQRLLQNSNLI